MCGRYVIGAPEDISERFQLRQLTINLPRTYNAAPSELLPVIFEDDAGEREARLMQWGLVPRWSKGGDKASVAPINARAESLLEKPMFRPLMKNRRCLIPANGFYEWQQRAGGKQPFYISVLNEPLFAFAGLYDEKPQENGEVIGSYTMVTTTANELVAPFHNRMPVILHQDDEEEWLSRDITDGLAVEHLLQPYPAGAMEAHPVSRAVNNVRNDGPELIAAE
jgi:putative SOS response-associated peptidase YedK